MITNGSTKRYPEPKPRYKLCRSHQALPRERTPLARKKIAKLDCISYKAVLRNESVGWGPWVHTYNPSYSGGRDQEDHGLKPAPGNSSTRPYLEKNHHKKRLVEWFKV
jgi:hypothetical protein